MQEKEFTYFKLQRMFIIVFICCLSAVFFVGYDTIRAKVRDIKRRADIKMITKALDLYHDQHGSYPVSVDDWRGWDLTYRFSEEEDLSFLKTLKEAGLIDRIASDPINDETYHYRYKKYAAGDNGCSKSFYILQIINFELPTTNNGAGSCGEMNWVELAPNGYTVQTFD